MATWLEQCKERVLIMDGAMGTELQAHGLPAGEVQVVADGRTLPGNTLPYSSARSCRVTVTIIKNR